MKMLQSIHDCFSSTL